MIIWTIKGGIFHLRFNPNFQNIQVVSNICKHQRGMNPNTPMIITWESAAFKETVYLTGFRIWVKDIIITYQWYDNLPSSSTRTDTHCLRYMTASWYEFCFFIKNTRQHMPLGTQHRPTYDLITECKRVVKELDNTLKSNCKSLNKN